MELARYDKAKAALAECERIDEVKDWADKAAALAAYAKQADDEELERNARRVRLRARRRLGELSADMPKAVNQHDAALPTGGKSTTKREVLAAAGVSVQSAHRAEQLAAVPEDVFEEALASLSVPTERDIVKPRPHVSQNTGEMEWYTPPAIVESARKVLGGISLDPASSAKAQEIVQADRYIAAEEDALRDGAEWGSGERVFINPPYERELVKRFASELIRQIDANCVDAAIWLSNNSTDTQWAAWLMNVSTAVCFPTGRVEFLDGRLEPSGKPIQGQMILAVGGVDPAEFMREFAQYGPVAWMPGADFDWQGDDDGNDG